jgi:tetratricopeptide (TPR) repeat protein
MAQAGRPATGSARISDEPLEQVASWFQANSKALLIGAGGIAIAVAAVFAYRSMDASKREQASTALYEAQAPFTEGKFAEARSALEKVVQRYGGTASGQQAVLLLAQVMYEQGQYAEGIRVLEKARGSASREFAASMEALMAAGHEGMGDHAKAAEHYGKAAEAAVLAADKGQYRASQARSLMAAGKLDEAAKLWTELAAEEGSTFGQEAKVRLGEIAARR